VRQTLAIGSLPASIVKAYEDDDIDDDCIKLLAIAPKGRLNQWIKLYRDGNAPTWGSRLRSFLANDKQVVTTDVALFDVSNAKLATIEDIFEDETFFADAEQFWELQLDEIDRIKTEYEDKNWVVEIIEKRYSSWAYTELSKKKGGKVYIFVSDSGHVEVVQGVLSNTEFHALEKRNAGEDDIPAEKPKVKPEVTKKMNEYLLGYLTQAARTSVANNYELTQRVLLVMLLCEDGNLQVNHSEQFDRIEAEVTQGELSQTQAYKDLSKSSKAAYKTLGTKETDSHYSRDFSKLITKVMKLPIEDVQRAIQAVLVSAITPTCEAVTAIHKHVKPDMTDFWSAKDSPAFVQVMQGKPLLFSILESVSSTDFVTLYEKSKVVEIKDALHEKTSEVEGWLPAYFTGGAYANGVGAPLS